MSSSTTVDYDSSIKTMKLYSHFERVDNELRAAGHEDKSNLKPEDLYAFDHMVRTHAVSFSRNIYLTRQLLYPSYISID